MEAAEIEILKRLKEFLENLMGDRLLRMILFGSMARGDYNQRSDIDVALIICDLIRCQMGE
jgi:predicted nucleotidyltransferase